MAGQTHIATSFPRPTPPLRTERHWLLSPLGWICTPPPEEEAAEDLAGAAAEVMVAGAAVVVAAWPLERMFQTWLVLPVVHW